MAEIKLTKMAVRTNSLVCWGWCAKMVKIVNLIFMPFNYIDPFYPSLRASDCGGFSRCGARALGARASVVVARGLSSCGARAQLLCGMWDLPGPGLEPVSPALAGGCLTTAPPGKSFTVVILKPDYYRENICL